jgi:hypothetical protein
MLLTRFFCLSRSAKIRGCSGFGGKPVGKPIFSFIVRASDFEFDSGIRLDRSGSLAIASDSCPLEM